MKKNRFGLLSAVLCLAATLGCARYGVARYDPYSGRLVERTAVSGFLTTAAVKNLKASTVDNISTNGVHLYNRKVGVAEAAAKTDSDGIDALTRLFQAGVQTGAQAAAASFGVPIRLPAVQTPAPVQLPPLPPDVAPIPARIKPPSH